MNLVPLRYLSVIPITNGLGLSGANDNREWPRYIRTTDIAGPVSLRDDVFASQPPEIAQAAMLEPGDILMTAAGASIGKSVTFSESYPACYAGFLVRVRPLSSTHGRFLGYWMQSQHYWSQVEAGAVKSTIENFSASRYRSLQVPQPPSREQAEIVDFLDRETAKMDALITEQSGLVDVLRERRVSVIARAVNKGLDSAALFAASEISWLDDLPSHWETGLLKHLGDVTLGKMLQSRDSGDDIRAPYLRAANVQPDGVLRLDDAKCMWFSRQELSVLNLRAGDVVVVEGGMGGYGRAAYLSAGLDGWGYQNSINRVRPKGGADGRYIAYLLLMARQRGFVAAYCNVVSMPHLTAEKLAALPVPMPSPVEQRRIADYIDERTKKIDALIAEAEGIVAVAKERRTALITAAVTGGIDVRGEVA